MRQPSVSASVRLKAHKGSLPRKQTPSEGGGPTRASPTQSSLDAATETPRRPLFFSRALSHSLSSFDFCFFVYTARRAPPSARPSAQRVPRTDHPIGNRLTFCAVALTASSATQGAHGDQNTKRRQHGAHTVPTETHPPRDRPSALSGARDAGTHSLSLTATTDNDSVPFSSPRSTSCSAPTKLLQCRAMNSSPPFPAAIYSVLRSVCRGVTVGL